MTRQHRHRRKKSDFNRKSKKSFNLYCIQHSNWFERNNNKNNKTQVNQTLRR